MRIAVFAGVATLVFSSSAPAQKPDTSGWMLSDIHASIQNSIKVPGGLKSDGNGVRSAKAGAIVEIRATFSYFQTWQSVSVIGTSSIKLTGVPDRGGKPWATENIAIGFDSSQGCRYLDPKMKASDSQVLDGTPAQLSIANEKISITSQRLPLCLAFETSEPFQINGVPVNVSSRVQLQFRCMP